MNSSRSWDQWIGSIKLNPDIIYYKLTPLHELIYWSDSKRVNVARALNEYSDEAVVFDLGMKWMHHTDVLHKTV